MITQEYTTRGAIKIFHSDPIEDHSDYNATGLDNLFSLENTHFWFLIRKKFIYKFLNLFVNKSSNILDVGAGTGNVSKHLQDNGFTNISVGE